METIELQPEQNDDPHNEEKVHLKDNENLHVFKCDYDDDNDVELVLPSTNLPDDAKVYNNTRHIYIFSN